ncbi:MAG: porphobilinogen synthase [Candidatus Eisenbacteria bacterium]|nr:porphobilinogen synthase [Candidatus Eisenbacteria bacterium]
MYPFKRFRRLRQNEKLRTLVTETELSARHFIYPMFFTPGDHLREEIPEMPGICRFSIDEGVKEAREAFELGIPGVLLFGIPSRKDAVGSEAFSESGIIQKALRALKKEVPALLLVTDVCMCEYTDHGHCGVVKDGKVVNDETLELLRKVALSQVKAGADVVAPSDMMDGRVMAIREALDGNGFLDTPIMSYSAKFASAFYGPFREAAGSRPSFGDRTGYQMNPANSREAMREIQSDIEEGADIVMVKPALSYLDVIREARVRFDIPIAAYNVSGEYSMVKACAQKGWIDEKRIALEILTSIKRAGADIIISYHAKDATRWLKG